MNRYIFILLCLTIELFSSSNHDWIKVRSLQKDGINRIKINYVKNDHVKQGSILRLTAKNGSTIVFDVLINAYLQEVLDYKFKFSNSEHNNTLRFTLSNNYNQVIKTKEIKIKHYKYTEPTVSSKVNYNDSVITNSKFWEATTPEDAMKILFSSTNGVDDKIKIEMPKVHPSNRRVPMKIKTDIKLKSLAIFENTNPTSAVAVFFPQPNSIVDYGLKLHMSWKCIEKNIIIMAEGEDGTLYKSVKTFDLIGADMNCDGTGNGGGG